MKIFAVIDNYGEESRGEACWYEMPDSSIVRQNNPFFVPDFDPEFRIFPSLCLRIGRLGKSVSRRFAHRYVDAWTMGAGVMAMERLAQLRAAGMPWTRAVAFDRSCMLGNLQPIETLNQYGRFRAECCGESADYDLASLRLPVDAVIEAISADNTIKNGDIILAALSDRGLPAKPGARFEIKSEENNMTLIGINIR